MSLLYQIFQFGDPDDPDPDTRVDWEKTMREILGEPEPEIVEPVKPESINKSAAYLDRVFSSMYTNAEQFMDKIPGYVYVHLRKPTGISEDHVGDNDRAMVLLAGDSRLEILAESDEAKIPIFADVDANFVGRYFLGTMAENPEPKVIGLLTLTWLAQPQSRENPVSNLWGFADTKYVAFN